MHGPLGPRLNIARIFDQEYSNKLARIYNEIDFENNVNSDEPQDNLGYLGIPAWYRDKVANLKQISDKDFINVIRQNNRLKEIMWIIGTIDKDHNGYVT